MDSSHTAEKNAATPAEGPGTAFLSLIESIGAAVLLHRGGHIIHANAALEALTGFSRAELLAMDFHEIAHPASRELIKQRGEARLRGEMVEPRYEFRVATKAGKERWIEVFVAMTDFEGLPTVVATLTDLTERKRALAVQRHMQLALGQIIDGNPVPTFVINAHHEVTHWNKACAEITGVPAVELLGTNQQWRAFYPAERPVMADLVASGAIEAGFDNLYHGLFKRSTVAVGAYEAEAFFPILVLVGAGCSSRLRRCATVMDASSAPLKRCRTSPSAASPSRNCARRRPGSRSSWNAVRSSWRKATRSWPKTSHNAKRLSRSCADATLS